MSRSKSFTRMMQAAAKIQHNIALILEAKAVEAQKSSRWVCHHLESAAYEDHASHVKETMDIHDQMVEVIDGIAKMEAALAKNLKIVLDQKDQDGGGMDSGGLGDLFNLGGGGLK